LTRQAPLAWSKPPSPSGHRSRPHATCGAALTVTSCCSCWLRFAFWVIRHIFLACRAYSPAAETCQGGTSERMCSVLHPKQHMRRIMQLTSPSTAPRRECVCVATQRRSEHTHMWCSAVLTAALLEERSRAARRRKSARASSTGARSVRARLTRAEREMGSRWMPNTPRRGASHHFAVARHRSRR